MHDITVDLLSKGFTLKATAGALDSNDANSLQTLVMVFHKEGIVEDEEPTKEVKKEKKKKDKAEKKEEK